MAIGIAEIIGGGFGKLFKDIVGSFKLDPTEKAKLEAAIDEREWQFKMAEQAANFKIAEEMTKQVSAQIEVNKLEAQGNLYQSSWRPTVGYICCVGLLFQFFIRPIMSWGSSIYGWPAAPPLEMGDLVILLGGMLGLGTMRSVDKRR
jgi:hypothetical protein